MEHIKENLQEINERIAAAAEKSGRNPSDIKLVAVSKYFPLEAILAAYDCGQFIFGENRVQEMTDKAKVLPEDIRWHMIGHLQSNKVKPAVECAACIHSVDSLRLLKRIDRLAGECGNKPDVLLEFNLSGEDSKFGLKEKSAMKLAEAAAACENVKVSGLMTMAPFEAADDELNVIFGGLRELRDRMSSASGLVLPELSMGMSGDFEIAIGQGATLVRIGTAIFGKRDYQR
ncbi:YggS family pyridoxal phosphate-dependent enzyme [Lentisphaerota bacterium ZTH]|nr:YggS family pyridoxal phosphate-dependent enzyme [Lentisphaerota bacterium]WET07419.1 YggS family pyridoxal phosphate-dependent enzyme [Lentisphaerota bacterium ZTH]